MFSTHTDRQGTLPLPLLKQTGKILLYFAFCFPLFFQLSGQFFTSSECVFDPKGSLLLTPLPIALPLCFFGIVVTYRFENRHFGMGFVFAVFMALLFSHLILSEGENHANLDKFLLLIQFIVPLFAFILGRLYREPEAHYFRIEAILIYVLLLVIPLQLFSTFTQNRCQVVSDLQIFSLYQHIQYLPLIFISFYFLAISRLHMIPVFRNIFLILAPLIGIYSTITLQVSSIIFLFLSSLLFLILNKREWRFNLLTLVLIWAGVMFGLPQSVNTFVDKFSPRTILQTENLDKGNMNLETSPSISADLAVPRLIAERLIIWDYYMKGILSGPRAFLFGHISPPDRDDFPSAHNYYLDLLYNFGFFALIPFLYLISITLFKSIRLIIAGHLPKALVFPAFFIAYYLFVENLVKVPFRQPYSGMILFFFWGIYMEKLAELYKNSFSPRLMGDE